MKYSLCVLMMQSIKLFKKYKNIIIRYWFKMSNLVSTKNFNSMLLGYATADDLIKNFKERTLELSFNKLIHISLDGPNVNIKATKMLNKHF